jgi:hypothetical protein
VRGVAARRSADADLEEFFKGLPDDKCQAPHWGYVVTGKVTFKTATGEETFETGDAYYVPPGHTPVLYTGTEIIEFSPLSSWSRPWRWSQGTWTLRAEG